MTSAFTYCGTTTPLNVASPADCEDAMWAKVLSKYAAADTGASDGDPDAPITTVLIVAVFAAAAALVAAVTPPFAAGEWETCCLQRVISSVTWAGVTVGTPLSRPPM